MNSLLPKGRFTKLLLLLLGMLVVAPLLDAFLHLKLLEDLFLTAVFIYATYAFSRDKRLLITAVCLALPAIALTWLSPVVNLRWLTISGNLCDVAFIFTITIAILAHIFRQKDVSADVIAGAIVVYLLMAVMWSQLYWVLESFRPGQFNVPAGDGQITPALMRYFSLVTITTVGYGDITPLTPVARAFANLEAVMGQLYLVIQVAWLVGMHVTMKSK
ncbi:MAG: two pore domain potassium channel family protein [Desulfobacterales bacterium]|nr:two pore domain potassium channel family protein [Desulfobacterales bacterium]